MFSKWISKLIFRFCHNYCDSMTLIMLYVSPKTKNLPNQYNFTFLGQDILNFTLSINIYK